MAEQKTEKPRRRRVSKIGIKSVIAITVLGIVLFGLLSLAVSFGYATEETERNVLDSITKVKTYSQYIDGDAVKKYISTNELDDYYYHIQSVLELELSSTPTLRYFYVIAPIEGNEVAYVWDTGVDAASFMEHEIYNPEIFPQVMREVFQKNPRDRFFGYEDPTYGSIASAFYPIFDSTGNPVALVGADISVEYIDEEITFFVDNMAIVIGIVMVLAIVVFFFVVKKTILNPIRKLRNATENIVSEIESDKPLVIGIKTKDEFEEFAHSFERMTSDIKNYIKQLSTLMTEKEKLAAELDVAAKIQMSMLPRLEGEFAENEKFDLFASMHPAKEVGGDFFDFFMIDDKHMAMTVADVSGKGVPAALFMAKSISILRSVSTPGSKPSEILKKINELLIERNDEDYFVTMWLGIYDLETGQMVCANAGHEYPIIKRAEGTFELIKDKHGMVLGEIEGIKYTDYELDFGVGDILFMYSDGVPEATDTSDELFGTGRTVEALNEAGGENLSEMAKSLEERINRFVDTAPQFDDMTMLMFIRRK